MRRYFNGVFLLSVLPHLFLAQAKLSNEIIYSKADSLYTAGKYSASIELCYQLVKQRAFQKEDSLGVLSYRLLAANKFYSGNYTEALAYGDTALKLSDDLSGLKYKPLIYNIMGACYVKMGKSEESLKNMKAALNIRLRLGRDKGLAKAYQNLGSAYSSLLRHKEALACFKKAHQLSIEFNGPRHSSTALSKISIGKTYNSMGLHQKAIPKLKEGLKLMAENLGADHPRLISPYINTGRAYIALGKYNRAEELYFKALNAYQINFPNKKNDWLAGIYSNISTLYIYTVELDKALHYGEEALAIRKVVLEARHPKLAASYSNIGTIKSHMGQFEEALFYFDEAIAIYTHHYGINNKYSASTYLEIGAVLSKQKKYQEALLFNLKALNMHQSLSDTSSASIGNSFFRVAMAYEDMGELDEALKNYQESYRHLKEKYSPHHIRIAYLYCRISVIYSKKGLFTKAGKALEQAANAFNYKPGQPLVFQQVIYLRELQTYFEARQLFFEKQPEMPAYKDSILKNHWYKLAAIEARHVQLTNAEARDFYNESIYDAYEEAIHTFSQAGLPNYQKEAFVIAESSKKKQLGEGFYNAVSNLLSDSLLIVYEEIKESINYCEKRLFELEEKNEGNIKEQQQHYRDSLLGLKNDQARLLLAIKEDIPAYYELNCKPFQFSVEQYQQMLRTDQTLLEYFVGDSTLYIFVVNEDNFQLHRALLNFSLKEEVEQLRSSIYDYYTAFKGSDSLYHANKQQYTSLAYSLYNKLIKPVEDHLRKEVVIVADGVLNFIPFEALLTKEVAASASYTEMPYWIREKLITYQFSAYEMYRSRHKEQKDLSNKVAVFAPTYHSNINELLQKHRTDLRFKSEPLKYNVLEAESIAKVYESKLYLDSLSNKKAFEDAAQHYRILHLATHGKSYHNKGVYSYLAFSSDSAGKNLEHILFVEDLYQMELNSELVVLSACETGIGELKKGMGVVSLSKALAFAGVSSQISTLWKIADQSTGSFMPEFYKELKKGLDKHQALRNSKLAFIREEAYAAPFFWAAYTLSGDTSPVHRGYPHIYLTAIVLILILGAISWYLLAKKRS